MSECVVRMEMPLNCLECPMYDWNRQKLCCNAHLDLRPIPNGGAPKPDWCPIICQLPEGHGRLIDASTIIGEVDAGYTDDYGNPIPVNRPVSVDEWLGLEVPTIVPVEAQRKVNASDAVAPTDTPTDTPTVPAERSET